jgi:hypothetical protein
VEVAPIYPCVPDIGNPESKYVVRPYGIFADDKPTTPEFFRAAFGAGRA